MAEVREHYALERSFEPLNAFFVPFFFLVIGIKLDVGALAAVWPLTAVLIVLAIVTKFAGGALGRGGWGAFRPRSWGSG